MKLLNFIDAQWGVASDKIGNRQSAVITKDKFKLSAKTQAETCCVSFELYDGYYIHAYRKDGKMMLGLAKRKEYLLDSDFDKILTEKSISRILAKADLAGKIYGSHNGLLGSEVLKYFYCPDFLAGTIYVATFSDGMVAQHIIYINGNDDLTLLRELKYKTFFPETGNSEISHRIGNGSS